MHRIGFGIVLAVLALTSLPACQSGSFLDLGGVRGDPNDVPPVAHPAPADNGLAGPPPATSNPECPTVIASVSTVLSPEATKRQISLAECIALALENGRTGEFFDHAGTPGATGATGLTRQQTPGAVTDSIRVFTYDPAILGTLIDESLSKFDASWQTGLIWNRFDEAPALNTGSVPAASQAFVNEGAIATEIGGFVSEFGTLGSLDLVQFRTGLFKPLPTGGVAGITFQTNYQNFQNAFGTPPALPFIPSTLNTTYRPSAQLTLEQPLLRGAGVAINQLRDTLPGSLLNPYLPVGGRVPGILLTRIAHDQAQTEFERRVHALLFAVEQAYWQLASAYWDLYSREAGIEQAQAAWQTAKTRAAMGGTTPEDLAQIEAQFHSFRKERLAALGRGSPGRLGVLEAERRLRYVIGLPPEDGTRLIPVDTPSTTPFNPDWTSAFTEALARRPELQQIQQDIKAAQLNIDKARDLLKADLRFISSVNMNGLGTTLGSALDNFEDDAHHDWELGLLMHVPIGFREGHAEVTRANLQLAQRFALLRDQEAKVVFSLQRSFRELVQFQEEARIARSQEQAAANQLKARYAKFKAGRETIDLLLRAQREWVDALRDENTAICNYNAALADFERQKGTIMQYENVSIAEGPLPVCAQERASAHIREWKRALVLKQAPAAAPGLEAPSCVAPTAQPALQEAAAAQPLPQLSDRGQVFPNDSDRPLPPALPGRLGFSENLDQPEIEASQPAVQPETQPSRPIVQPETQPSQPAVQPETQPSQPTVGVLGADEGSPAETFAAGYVPPPPSLPDPGSPPPMSSPDAGYVPPPPSLPDPGSPPPMSRPDKDN